MVPEIKEMAIETTQPSPPGPGEAGFDKMAVPKYVLELLKQDKSQKEVLELTKERFPYTRLNSNHIAWMASAQSFSDLDIEGDPE